MDELDSDFASATSKLLSLVMEKDDGTLLHIQLIRSDTWIDESAAEVGGEIFLDLPEMSAVGFAHVLAIDQCPPIEPGDGNVVTGTSVMSRRVSSTFKSPVLNQSAAHQATFSGALTGRNSFRQAT